MAYDEKLADRIREYLSEIPDLVIEEKKMFRGRTFMVNGKMCVGVSGDELMLRFDPNLHNDFCEQNGFRPMLTKGRIYKGYGYINPDYLKTNKQLNDWLDIALQFNKEIKAKKK